MTHRGIVKGKVIELEAEVALPHGTPVDVELTERPAAGAGGHPKGSPAAILAALAEPARCAPEDVDAFLEAIEAGKRPVDFRGPFDTEEALR